MWQTDNSTCQSCAEACRRCAEECRKMACQNCHRFARHFHYNMCIEP
ncbi:four-helix bundle copper-binding protein [Effusibacillus dendaii]|nr:four-helix bundle copper-binding protein [Effusibacillus dendaii]